MTVFHIFQAYHKLGDHVIDTVLNINKLDEYLIKNIRQSFRYLELDNTGKDEYMDRVCAMSSVALIAEAIDVGRETLQNDAGYGIVAVIEGGIMRQ